MPINIVNVTYYFHSNANDVFTIPSTTAGNVLIATCFSYMANLSATVPPHWNSPAFISSDIDGVFTQVPYYGLPGQSGTPWDWGFIPNSGTPVDILYVLTAGGATQITFNSNAPNGVTMFLYEVSGLVTTPVTVDDFQVTGSPTDVAVLGAALAGSGSNDLCLQNIATWNGNIRGITSPWTLDPNTDFANGAAYIVGSSGTESAPTWTDNHGNIDTYTCVSAAFLGVGAAGPNITGLSASCGSAGDSVTISGLNFGVSQGGSTVDVNGTSASVTSWSDNSIVIVIPGGATTGNIVVTVATPSNGVLFTIPCPAVPVITSTSIDCGDFGDTVTVNGSGFEASQGAGFAEVEATVAQIVSWSDTQIVLIIPIIPVGGGLNQIAVVNNTGNTGTFSFIVCLPNTIAVKSNVTNGGTPSAGQTFNLWNFPAGFFTGFWESYWFYTGPNCPSIVGDAIQCNFDGNYYIGASYDAQTGNSFSLLLNGVSVGTGGAGQDLAVAVTLHAGDMIQLLCTATIFGSIAGARIWMTAADTVALAGTADTFVWGGNLLLPTVVTGVCSVPSSPLGQGIAFPSDGSIYLVQGSMSISSGGSEVILIGSDDYGGLGGLETHLSSAFPTPVTLNFATLFRALPDVPATFDAVVAFGADSSSSSVSMVTFTKLSQVARSCCPTPPPAFCGGAVQAVGNPLI